MVRQIPINLIKNGRGAGGIVSVRAYADAAARKTFVEVHDTGAGGDPAVLEDIFVLSSPPRRAVPGSASVFRVTNHAALRRIALFARFCTRQYDVRVDVPRFRSGTGGDSPYPDGISEMERRIFPVSGYGRV